MENRNLQWNKRVKVPLILIFSVNTNHESVAYRSFSPSKFEARGARKVTQGDFSNRVLGRSSQCDTFRVLAFFFAGDISSSSSSQITRGWVRVPEFII